MRLNRAVFVLVFFISMSFLYAEAPELRNVMPNSWRKVTRLSDSEETEFIQNNSDVVRKILEVTPYPISSPDASLNIADAIEENTRVYRQEAGGHVFYRLITSENMCFNNDNDTLFLQSLLYNRDGENILVAAASYRAHFAYQYGAYFYYSSIDIIGNSDSISGILLSLVGVNSERDASLLKGQIAGSSSAFYFRWEDISGITKDEEKFDQEFYALLYPSTIPNVHIRASGCLVDPRIPLRYSIQNAFDGDHATSYVENTDDDFLCLNFSGSIFTESQGKIKKIALINGYAQNIQLYKNNNRIKILETYNDANPQVLLRDDFLNYQFIEDATVVIGVSDIYYGNRYNDTCIAELNILTQNGWLFGGINE
jgi:hypothetical protein